ncbi:MAG: GNAT family N-acetyltransferase [Planctomycetota bacterium]
MDSPAIPVPLIRKATLADAAPLAHLMTELGHPTTPAELQHRYAAWESEGNIAFVAANDAGELLGVVTLHRMHVLHRPLPVGRITALVVDRRLHGRGIGRRLVSAAEDHLAGLGCGLVEVTSNLRRTDAHAFYERIGYERTSARFAKSVQRARGVNAAHEAAHPGR